MFSWPFARTSVVGNKSSAKENIVREPACAKQEISKFYLDVMISLALNIWLLICDGKWRHVLHLRRQREGSYTGKPPRPEGDRAERRRDERRSHAEREPTRRRDRDRYEQRYRDIDPSRKYGNLRKEREDERKRGTCRHRYAWFLQYGTLAIRSIPKKISNLDYNIFLVDRTKHYEDISRSILRDVIVCCTYDKL